MLLEQLAMSPIGTKLPFPGQSDERPVTAALPPYGRRPAGPFSEQRGWTGNPWACPPDCPTAPARTCRAGGPSPDLHLHLQDRSQSSACLRHQPRLAPCRRMPHLSRPAFTVVRLAIMRAAPAPRPWQAQATLLWKMASDGSSAPLQEAPQGVALGGLDAHQPGQFGGRQMPVDGIANHAAKSIRRDRVKLAGKRVRPLPVSR